MNYMTALFWMALMQYGFMFMVALIKQHGFMFMVALIKQHGFNQWCGAYGWNFQVMLGNCAWALSHCKQWNKFHRDPIWWKWEIILHRSSSQRGLVYSWFWLLLILDFPPLVVANGSGMLYTYFLIVIAYAEIGDPAPIRYWLLTSFNF